MGKGFSLDGMQSGASDANSLGDMAGNVAHGAAAAKSAWGVFKKVHSWAKTRQQQSRENETANQEGNSDQPKEQEQASNVATSDAEHQTAPGVVTTSSTSYEAQSQSGQPETYTTESNEPLSSPKEQQQDGSQSNSGGARDQRDVISGPLGATESNTVDGVQNDKGQSLHVIPEEDSKKVEQ
eukprot:gb/GECG01004767.1/.p1 GENE.gb/GECG01004767.1/~~gb/GECG01004767.1/.p1  ORF type:complete len:182 (+),score=33.30 gb/GECG01004767.1/:1-546(+)